MEKFQLNQMMQDDSFPMIEATYAKSSNVNGDAVFAYAVTEVKIVSLSKRLDSLTNLVGLNLPDPVIISGFAYSSSDSWTVADEIISKKKKYDQDNKFKVIWLKNKYISSKYHGYAGYEIRKLIGIVIKYPEELSNVA